MEERFFVNAFTGEGFKGNPACVVILEHPLSDKEMQTIAAENALPETGFILPMGEDGSRLSLRWFTPDVEMDLCGHCTLASAHIAFTQMRDNYPTGVWSFPDGNTVRFDTVEGPITIVHERENVYTLEFPIRMPVPAVLPDPVLNSLSIKPVEVFKSRDYMLVYNSRNEIEELCISDRGLFDTINIDPGGVIVTAASSGECDFVSRFFTPQATILEDPVTGSAHCTLVPFWAERLGKRAMRAFQLSNNGGCLDCVLTKTHVLLSGEVR